MLHETIGVRGLVVESLLLLGMVVSQLVTASAADVGSSGDIDGYGGAFRVTAAKPADKGWSNANVSIAPFKSSEPQPSVTRR